MFYFGRNYIILILKRMLRFLEMAALVWVAVVGILALTIGMCA